MYNIGVIGGGKANEKYREVSIELGRILASRKAVVFCGGMSGVMEWVAHGVKDGNGIIVGVLPGMNMETGNGYLTVKMPTGIGYARNFLIVRASEAIIAVDGATGTISEATFALSEGKSVIIIGDLDLERRKPDDGQIFRVGTATEAVDVAFEEARKQRRKIAEGWRLPDS